MQADSTLAARVCALAGLWIFAPGAIAGAAASGAPDGPPAPAAESRPLDFATLLARFAALPGFVAPFSEEKRLALLREPLVSRGRISYEPPQRLVRVIDEPAASRVVVDGEWLTYSSAGEQGSLGLDAHPTLRIFVDSLRMLLQGDLHGLREAFQITFSNVGPPEALGWTVVLEPRSEALRRSLAAIRIEGEDRSLRVFQIRERNGDVTRMTFGTADP